MLVAWPGDGRHKTYVEREILKIILLASSSTLHQKKTVESELALVRASVLVRIDSDK